MTARRLPSILRGTMLLLAVAGCARQGDMDRPGTWQAGGLNDRNLRAMLAEPAHAFHGVGATTDRGEAGNLAIDLLRQDRRRPLPDSRASSVGAVSSGAPPAMAPGASHAP